MVYYSKFVNENLAFVGKMMNREENKWKNGSFLSLISKSPTWAALVSPPSRATIFMKTVGGGTTVDSSATVGTRLATARSSPLVKL